MNITALKTWTARIRTDWKLMNSEFNPPRGSSRTLIFVDYVVCVFKYRISYSEYFEQYKFYGLRPCEREQFVTRAQAHRIQTKLNRTAKDVFWFKDRFLYKFGEFAKRDWLHMKEATFEDFKKFASIHNRFIVKPVTGSLGKGIQLMHIDDNTNFHLLYNDLQRGDNILEEHITACSEIAEFNPDSLNTIRVVTFFDGTRFKVIGSFIRMGVKGSAIDNAHAGGVFATVDVNTGIVTTLGVNTNGQKFLFHPTSQKQIIGFQIPRWKDIVNLCRHAASNIPEAKIVGWDVAITRDNSVLIIEGNHMPDFDVMQSPSRTGVKKHLLEAING